MNSVMKSFGSAVILLMLTAGVLGLAYARWTHAVADADAALANGDLTHALADYAAAQARFDALPAARQLFAAEYNRVVGNELWVLYQLGRFDETIDKAEKAPDAASPHFFSACAFFEKGSLEPKPEARLGWFSRAEDEFRRAVEAAPGDWDTKYDFELTTRLTAELRKQPKAPPKQLMQLLRPPTPTGKPPKRVG